MSSTRQYLIVLSAMCVIVSNIAPEGALSQSRVDLERERAELLQVHRNIREAHFKTDVDLLVDRMSEELVSVRDGKVTRPSKRSMHDFFSAYFRGAKYYEWDDIEAPVVRVSQDGTMGWMITNVKVRRTQSTSAAPETVEFVFAGISTYEKREGRWMEVANVSTFEPRR